MGGKDTQVEVEELVEDRLFRISNLALVELLAENMDAGGLLGEVNLSVMGAAIRSAGLPTQPVFETGAPMWLKDDYEAIRGVVRAARDSVCITAGEGQLRDLFLLKSKDQHAAFLVGQDDVGAMVLEAAESDQLVANTLMLCTERGLDWSAVRRGRAPIAIQVRDGVPSVGLPPSQIADPPKSFEEALSLLVGKAN